MSKFLILTMNKVKRKLKKQVVIIPMMEDTYRSWEQKKWKPLKIPWKRKSLTKEKTPQVEAPSNTVLKIETKYYLIPRMGKVKISKSYRNENQRKWLLGSIRSAMVLTQSSNVGLTKFQNIRSVYSLHIAVRAAHMFHLFLWMKWIM